MLFGWWEQNFSPAEMDVVLCGERSIEWDKASLSSTLSLSAMSKVCRVCMPRC